MKLLRLLTAPLFAGALLSMVALSFSSAVTAQDKEQTPTTDGSSVY